MFLKFFKYDWPNIYCIGKYVERPEKVFVKFDEGSSTLVVVFKGFEVVMILAS